MPGAPAWLVPAFVRSVSAIGATAPREVLEAEGEALVERWSTPDRYFHGIPHLTGVLERVDTLAHETHNPDLVRVAAWYHGAVFDSSMLRHYRRAAGENKPESAGLAHRHLLQLGVPGAVAERVRELILDLTRHDADPSDVDARALCDADLGSIAIEPQRYKTYRAQVRQEFAHLPVRDYVEARIAIATRLLARPALFLSPLAASWEHPARQNLEAELVHLRAELEKLPEQEEAPAQEEVPGREAPPERPEEPGSEELPERAEEPGEAAEVVGIPFEDRPRTETPAEQYSGMEQDPIGPSTIPKRVPAAEKLREATRRSRAGLSTDPAEAPDSTGSLFRPIDL